MGEGAHEANSCAPGIACVCIVHIASRAQRLLGCRLYAIRHAQWKTRRSSTSVGLDSTKITLGPAKTGRGSTLFRIDLYRIGGPRSSTSRDRWTGRVANKRVSTNDLVFFATPLDHTFRRPLEPYLKSWLQERPGRLETNRQLRRLALCRLPRFSSNTEPFTAFALRKVCSWPGFRRDSVQST